MYLVRGVRNAFPTGEESKQQSVGNLQKSASEEAPDFFIGVPSSVNKVSFCRVCRIASKKRRKKNLTVVPMHRAAHALPFAELADPQHEERDRIPHKQGKPVCVS